jgi:hypothetical protein
MYGNPDALSKMEEKIDAIELEVTKLSGVHNNIGKLEGVLDETRQQVQNLNLHLGKMQSVAETYNKFMGVLLVVLTVLIPIGFSAVAASVTNNSVKIDTALKTSYDAQKHMEIYKYQLDGLSDRLDIAQQEQKRLLNK